MSSKLISQQILEEYTKRNNIEYGFILTAKYSIGSMFEIDIKKERIFISIIDSNNNILQFEEIDCSNVNDDVLYEDDIIPIAKRLIRDQRLKEIGI